ncbi:MAG TPA: hypothetical protein VKB69_15110 [Micromonosporaceae bacterium]|nr:hypothetical protein [Micromonosporaceae bacterium]
MTDQDIRQVILDAVPPLPAPPDRIEAIGRRVRRQRLGYAGMSVAGVVAVAVAAATFALLPGGSGHAPSVRTQSPLSVPNGATATTARQQEAARLTAELKRVMADALPDAQFRADSTFDGTPAYVVGPALVFADHGDHFSAGAIIRDSAGTGSVQVLSGRKDSIFGSIRGCPRGLDPKDIKFSCDTQPGPDGAVIVESTTTRGTWKAYQVLYIRADGNSVIVRVSNASNESDEATRATPPLTKDQTLALASDPALATTVS